MIENTIHRSISNPEFFICLGCQTSSSQFPTCSVPSHHPRQPHNSSLCITRALGSPILLPASPLPLNYLENININQSVIVPSPYRSLRQRS